MRAAQCEAPGCVRFRDCESAGGRKTPELDEERRRGARQLLVHEPDDGMPRAFGRGPDLSAVFVDVWQFHGSTCCNSARRLKHARDVEAGEPR